MRHPKKLPRKPLEEVLFNISSAQEIILRLYRDGSYMADDYDFALMHKITQKSDQFRILANHTEIALHQRLKGLLETPLPEGFGKQG